MLNNVGGSRCSRRSSRHLIPLGLLVQSSEVDPGRDTERSQEQCSSSGHDDGEVREVGLSCAKDHSSNGGSSQHADTAGGVHETDHGRQLMCAKGLRDNQGHQRDVTTSEKAVDESKGEVDAERFRERPDDQDRASGHPGTETDDGGLGQTVGSEAEGDSSKAGGAARQSGDQGTILRSETDEQAVRYFGK